MLVASTENLALFWSDEKNSFKYSCEKCDFYSNNKNDYNRHLQTKKHFGNMETNWKQKKRSNKRVLLETGKRKFFEN